MQTRKINRSNRIRAVRALSRATRSIADQGLEMLESRRLMTGTGLQAQYFNNMDFTSPVLTRADATVNANWGNSAPASSMQADTFSARWTGQVEAPATGTYTFYTRADDGVKLWVNGQLLVNRWTDRTLAGDVNNDGAVDTVDFSILTSNFGKTANVTKAMGDLNGDGAIDKQDMVMMVSNWNETVKPQEDSGTIALEAGKKYDIRVDYYDNTGDASVQLSWTTPGAAKAVVPTSALYPAAVDPSSTRSDITVLTLINADTDQAIGAL